jgi:deferrochelatase/peroxidase EfeB
VGSDRAAPFPSLDEVQGNILRAYGKDYRAVRHLVLRVADSGAARRALALMVDGDRATPDVTSAQRPPSEAGFGWCLNLGFTYAGLVRLGVPEASLASFPPEFIEGMVPRAARLGDTGASAPTHWVGGLADPSQVHLIVTIHGRDTSDIDGIAEQVMAAAGGRAFALTSRHSFEGEVLLDQTTGQRLVHFDFADGISQPRFLGIHDSDEYPDQLPFAPIGTVLLGYPSVTPHVQWKVPEPAVLGCNGAFNAFRVLGQDVPAFEDFLSHAAATLGVDRELVAAKLCGRWRCGVPLSLAPTPEAAAAFSGDGLNDFDYVNGDPDGEICPIGSHIRRTNPRGTHIVQRAANRTRTMIRRGIPYGPRWDPDDPSSRYQDRGLLGNFICASLSTQFEAMQYDWVNMGFQDPRITGSNDPLVGANDAATSTFTWPRAGAEPWVLRGFPRFISTRGGAYTFLPSIPAIRWISAQG